MRILGLDVGERWIGVAASDLGEMLASPLTRVRAGDDEASVREIDRIVREQKAGLVVVGMPYSLSGAAGPQARRVQEFVDRLSRSLSVPIETCDERSSTIAAEQMLEEAGIPREKRKEKIDAVAAAFILQSYLDGRRNAGLEPESSNEESGRQDEDRQIVALIGHPVKHSISPRFQQAALDYHGLNITYERWDIPPDGLHSAMDRLRHPSCLGANITIPHKEAVLEMADVIDDQAKLIGAVNTITNREGRLHGFNTDAPGFIRALRHYGGLEPAGKSVLVLGAGGAARAVCFALLGEGVAGLAIANRRVTRAADLAAALWEAGTRGEVKILEWSTMRETDRLAAFDLIVNCTPLGMKYGQAEDESPIPAACIPENALVCDLVYNPMETAFIREARKAGARVLGGLPMLVYQGAVSFGIWTGREAPVELMMETAKASLT